MTQGERTIATVRPLGAPVKTKGLWQNHLIRGAPRDRCRSFSNFLKKGLARGAQIFPPKDGNDERWKLRERQGPQSLLESCPGRRER
jgi:hypothetical protein